MSTRTPTLAPLLLFVLLPACESAPLANATASGDSVIVEILDADFVRVDGARQPWEELVYAMRVRCRQARADGSEMPSVEFRLADPETIDFTAVDRISKGLRQAGVRRIDMGNQ